MKWKNGWDNTELVTQEKDRKENKIRNSSTSNKKTVTQEEKSRNENEIALAQLKYRVAAAPPAALQRIDIETR